MVESVSVAQPITYTDTFYEAEPSGAAISSHTPDAGGSWSLHGSYTANIVVSNANRARSAAGTFEGTLWYWSGTPASADYAVSADIYVVQVKGKAGVAGRVSTSAQTYYYARLDSSGQVELGKWVAGSETVLVTVSVGAPNVGSTHRIALIMQGGVLAASYDGTIVAGPIADSSISAAGKSGIYLETGNIAGGNSSNYHLDNYLAFDSIPLTLYDTPQRASIASVDPPRPHAGSVCATSAKPDAVAGVSVPARATIARTADRMPHHGAVIEAIGPTAQVSTDHAPPPAVVSGSPPPSPSGSVIARAGQPDAVAQVAIPPDARIAAQEPPHPHAGSALAIHAPLTLTVTAIPARTALIAVQPPAPYGGSVIARAGQPAATPAVATPRKAIIATAEAPRPYAGQVLGVGNSLNKRPPTDTSGGILYRIYTGAGSPINYGSAIATTDGLEWTSSALTYPQVYKYGIRVYDGATGLEERNVDAVIRFELDASGVDISAIPDAPVSLSGHADAGGAITVHWAYRLSDPQRKPTGFKVYQGTGGSPSYGSPVATVAYSLALQIYSATISSLSDGTAYTFGVRAYNATGEETNTRTATVTADATGPATVFSLAGGSVS